MNKYVLYRAGFKITPKHQPLILGDNEKVIFVRAERIASDAAPQPQENETVLATIEL